MKRLLTILVILCSTLTYGQSAKHRTVGTDTTCIDSMKVSLKMIGDLFLPIKGHFAPQWDSLGALAYDPTDSSVYVFTKYNWIKIGGAAGLGTVTMVSAGAGLSGGDITTTGTISMPDVGTAGTYGDATHIPAITTDAQGRVTGVTTYTFTSGGSTLDTSYIYAAILLKKDKSDSLPGTGYTSRDRLQAKADSIIAWAEATFLSTETDPVFLTYPAAGVGAGDISNWDNAYSNRITSLTTSGSSGAATLISNTLNVPEYTASGLGAIATTEATVTPTPNKILKRDAYGNGYVNNLIQNGTTTAAANGTTAMDLASTLFQEQTGSSGNDQTYTLPDATTLTDFTPYVFDNNSDGLMVINDFANALVVSIAPGGRYEVRLQDNGTAAGTWHKQPYLAHGTNVSTSGIQFTGFVSASGSVTGSNLSGTNTGDQNTFTSIPVSGQTTVTANSTTTALTLVAGSGVGITTDNTAKSITITATGGGGTVTDVIGGTNIQITGTSTIQPTVNITGQIAVANGGTGVTTQTSVNTIPITYGADNTVTASALTLTTTTLNPTVVTSSLTSVGTIGAGTWSSTIGSAATGSTQAINTNSTQIATTAYVDRYFPVDTTISAAYTLTSRDFHRTIHCTNGSNIALTVPTGLGTTFTCVVLAEGAGTVTPTTSSTTFYYQPTSTTKIKSQGGATIRSWATANSYLIIGSLE